MQDTYVITRESLLGAKLFLGVDEIGLYFWTDTIESAKQFTSIENADYMKIKFGKYKPIIEKVKMVAVPLN